MDNNVLMRTEMARGHVLRQETDLYKEGLLKRIVTEK